jgi:UPF0755 protein
MRAFDFGYELMAKESEESTEVVDVNLTIPEGSSTEAIANILLENGLISNSLKFRIVSKLSGYDDEYQYGEYALNTGMSDDDIMTILRTEGAKRETVSFTIPEGYTIEQIANKLSDEGLCTVEAFMEAAESTDYGYSFLEDIPDRENPLQGYLFPDTYQIYTDATAQDIVETMLSQFDDIFKDEYYVIASELGYSVDEIVTIASIIEREAKLDDERATIAGVIYNRLDINMNLEMCSTVMYALDETKDVLTIEDTKIESPYNTYVNSGLPVGPIANPGEKSIIAALFPEEHNYYFFVLVNEETGAHEFNETFAGHSLSIPNHD